MADLSITPASVVKGSNAVLVGDPNSDYFGEACTRGQLLYRLSTDKKLYKAKADGTAAQAVLVGVAMVDGAAGQPAVYQSGGTVAIGATTVAGTIYCASTNAAGGVNPWADLVATDRVSIFGVGDGAGNIVIGINNTGILHA